MAAAAPPIAAAAAVAPLPPRWRRTRTPLAGQLVKGPRRGIEAAGGVGGLGIGDGGGGRGLGDGGGGGLGNGGLGGGGGGGRGLGDGGGGGLGDGGLGGGGGGGRGLGDGDGRGLGDGGGGSLRGDGCGGLGGGGFGGLSWRSRFRAPPPGPPPVAAEEVETAGTLRLALPAKKLNSTLSTMDWGTVPLMLLLSSARYSRLSGRSSGTHPSIWFEESASTRRFGKSSAKVAGRVPKILLPSRLMPSSEADVSRSDELANVLQKLLNTSVRGAVRR